MLTGRKIAITEHRYERELIKLIENRGGQALSCPLLEECLVENLPELEAFVHRVIDPGFDSLIFFTGVGFRFMYEQSVRMGVRDAFLASLDQTDVIARGPKPQSAMRKLGVRVDRAPVDATSDGLLELLRGDDLRTRRIGVQLYGVPNPGFCQPLEARGAEVQTVQVYDYRAVSDAEQVARFIKLLGSGFADAVTFTSAPQVRALFEHAGLLGLREELVRALREAVVVVAVGRVTNQALVAFGVEAGIIPSTPKMGHMVASIDDYFSRAQS